MLARACGHPVVSQFEINS